MAENRIYSKYAPVPQPQLPQAGPELAQPRPDLLPDTARRHTAGSEGGAARSPPRRDIGNVPDDPNLEAPHQGHHRLPPQHRRGQLTGEPITEPRQGQPRERELGRPDLGTRNMLNHSLLLEPSQHTGLPWAENVSASQECRSILGRTWGCNTSWVHQAKPAGDRAASRSFSPAPVPQGPQCVGRHGGPRLPICSRGRLLPD